jgi:hypothetical protein
MSVSFYGAISPDGEAGCPAGWHRRFDGDIIDARARGPAAQRPLDSQHGFLVSLEHRLDPPIGQVPHETVHALDGGMVLHEVPEPDSLDLSTDEEPLRDNHGKR